MKNKLINKTLTVFLEGRIDSTNAAETEKEFMALIEHHDGKAGMGWRSDISFEQREQRRTDHQALLL